MEWKQCAKLWRFDGRSILKTETEGWLVTLEVEDQAVIHVNVEKPEPLLKEDRRLSSR
jgi:hypothetical protein